jgi:hypothetical protein
VDLSGTGVALGDDEHVDLRCNPVQARSRLRMLAYIGFDDAVVTVSDFSEAHMRAVRELFA